jgi:hypothetical protein
MNNKNNEYLITWQKWSDPFGRDEEDKDYDPYLGDYDSEIDSDQITEQAPDLPVSIVRSGIRVIATPMGIIPMNDNTISSKIFNFWVGHTNFNLTKMVVDVIEQTDGVETLDIFTRYRFRIAVGKVFDDSSVMRDINSRVYGLLNNDQ